MTDLSIDTERLLIQTGEKIDLAGLGLIKEGLN